MINLAARRKRNNIRRIGASLEHDEKPISNLFIVIVTISMFSILVCVAVMFSLATYGLPYFFERYIFFNKSPLIAGCENNVLFAQDISIADVKEGDVILYRKGKTFSVGYFIKEVGDKGHRKIAASDSATPDLIIVFDEEDYYGKVTYKNDIIGKIIIGLDKYGFQILIIAAIIVFVPMICKQ